MGWNCGRPTALREGTALFHDFLPGAQRSDLQLLGSVGGNLYVNALDGKSYGMWTSDGTEKGTLKLRKSRADSIVDVEGLAYFYGSASNRGVELWKTDG